MTVIGIAPLLQPLPQFIGTTVDNLVLSFYPPLKTILQYGCLKISVVTAKPLSVSNHTHVYGLTNQFSQLTIHCCRGFIRPLKPLLLYIFWRLRLSLHVS